VTPEALPRPTPRLGPRGRLTAAIGVGLLALILVAVGLPEVHVHTSHETGLYDETCPLLTLALGPAKGVVHDPSNAPHLSTLTQPSPLASPAVLLALPLAPLRARAPPTAG
jgi:hypothetical protein